MQYANGTDTIWHSAIVDCQFFWTCCVVLSPKTEYKSHRRAKIRNCKSGLRRQQIFNRWLAAWKRKASFRITVLDRFAKSRQTEISVLGCRGALQPADLWTPPSNAAVGTILLGFIWLILNERFGLIRISFAGCLIGWMETRWRSMPVRFNGSYSTSVWEIFSGGVDQLTLKTHKQSAQWPPNEGVPLRMLQCEQDWPYGHKSTKTCCWFWTQFKKLNLGYLLWGQCAWPASSTSTCR